MSSEVMQDYIFNQRAIHIQVGRGPQVSLFWWHNWCCFCGHVSTFLVFLLECYIFMQGILCNIYPWMQDYVNRHWQSLYLNCREIGRHGWSSELIVVKTPKKKLGFDHDLCDIITIERHYSRDHGLESCPSLNFLHALLFSQLDCCLHNRIMKTCMAVCCMFLVSFLALTTQKTQ